MTKKNENISIAICSKCQHQRMRPKAQLFSQSDLQAPGVLKSKLEWEQQDQERRQIEMQRLDAGQPFNYEPYHYAWCAAYTPYDAQLQDVIANALKDGEPEHVRQLAKESVKRGQELIRRAKADDTAALDELAESGRATMNPVTGEIMQIYALCARMNPTGQCPLFEPKSAPK
ncbi:hypothetical protein EDS67_00705 [candidate division KSB1 bacterium]|nr:MAG: hypothetical protein EDS67_00705 [candidate division KSB1 bacterium]MBC6946627.1 hypothetical protein [candidate division KSB1 bacterium]MCE7940108.1 hypothetical protein [Chlorobi bacterium CHB1]MDL1873594.1 hypothetical protein [Cytophagia bacterium CHB2]